MTTPNNHFARIPYTLFDARMRGEITALMFDLMLLYHRWADWSTGVARSVSANKLLYWLGGQTNEDERDGAKLPSLRTIQRHQQGLLESGWVLSSYRKGSKRPYNISICNYFPPDADRDADGDADKYPLNRRDTKHWMDTKINRGADRDADDDADGDADGTVTGRGRDGERAANNKILTDSTDSLDLQILEGRKGRKVGKPAALSNKSDSENPGGQEQNSATRFTSLIQEMSKTYEQRHPGRHLHLSAEQKHRLREFVRTFKPTGPNEWQQPEWQVDALFGLWATHHPKFTGINSIVDVFISQHDQELPGLAEWNRQQAETSSLPAEN